MKPARLLIPLGCLLVIALAILLTRPPTQRPLGVPPSGGSTQPQTPESTAPAPSAATLPPRDADEPPPPPEPAALPFPEQLDTLVMTLRDFRTSVGGGNPIGSNAEITEQILGRNLKQVKLPLPPGMRLNAKKEMIDSWGTPLFFHQLSGTEMEIHSAGPDRRFGTSDDTIVKN